MNRVNFCWKDICIEPTYDCIDKHPTLTLPSTSQIVKDALSFVPIKYRVVAYGRSDTNEAIMVIDDLGVKHIITLSMTENGTRMDSMNIAFQEIAQYEIKGYIA